MSDQNTAFVGSVPEKYDKYLGPILFDTKGVCAIVTTLS